MKEIFPETPDYIFWGVVQDRTMLKNPTKLLPWIKMMNDRHRQSNLLQRKLEESETEKQRLLENLDFVNEKCQECGIARQDQRAGSASQSSFLRLQIINELEFIVNDLNLL